MNTCYKGTIINDDKREIVWIPDIGTKLHSKTLSKNNTASLVASGKIKLRPKTFIANDLPFLLSSNALFARKFDETVDSAIIDMLELRLKVFRSRQSFKLRIRKENVHIQPFQSMVNLQAALV